MRLGLIFAILACSSCTTDDAASGSTADLAAVGSDLAAIDVASGGCAAPCGDTTPFCNASGYCVACLVDGDCPPGSICRASSASQSSCEPGCAGDLRCRAGDAGVAMACC